MSRISEKVAYLGGLLEGLDPTDEKAKKLFVAVIDALDLIAEELTEHADQISDLEDTVDGLVDDLGDFEEMLLGDDDDDFDIDDYLAEDDDGDENEDFFDEEDFMEITCAACGETIYFDVEMLDAPGGLICASCNAPIEIDR